MQNSHNTRHPAASCTYQDAGAGAVASRGDEEEEKKSNVPTYLPFFEFF
jgi:hypothetical protein